MSANDRTFDDVVAEAKTLLEGHDDEEYEALAASEKANYQEAIEFLSRLESALDAGEDERGEADQGASSPEALADGGETFEGVEIETDLEATMGDDGNVVGPFGGDDVVVYDPAADGEGEGWLSMRHDATIPLENMQ